MLKNICFLSVIACVYGLDNPLSFSSAETAQIIDYIFNNDGLGNYKYGFSTTNGIERYEESVVENPGTESATTIVRGSYSYPGADGKMVKVKYTADKDGFHPEGDSISVSPYVVSDNKEHLNKAQPTGGQRFNRQYGAENDNNYNTNPQNFENYHTHVSQLLQQDDGHYGHEQFLPFSQNENYNNELQENNQPEHFNYDKSLLELLGSNNQENNNYNQQTNRQKPIIAILGDDGKLVDSANFDNLNLPESILEILNRGNLQNNEETPVIAANPKVHPKDDVIISGFKSVKEAMAVKSKESKKIKSSSHVTSVTVDQPTIEVSTVASSTIESSKS